MADTGQRPEIRSSPLQADQNDKPGAHLLLGGGFEQQAVVRGCEGYRQHRRREKEAGECDPRGERENAKGSCGEAEHCRWLSCPDIAFVLYPDNAVTALNLL